MAFSWERVEQKRMLVVDNSRLLTLLAEQQEQIQNLTKQVELSTHAAYQSY